MINFKLKTKLLTIILILGLWQLIDIYLSNGNKLIPSPIVLLLSLFESLKDKSLLVDFISSIQRVLVGFVIATIFAIPLGLAAANYKILSYIINPFVELLRPIPPIAWIPLSIIIFGLGNVSSYFIVFLGAFFPIFSNSYLGASSLPQSFKRVALSFEIKTFDYFNKVLLQFSLPYIFTGLKIGIGMAWMSVIASELVSGQSGLGYFIQINRLLLNLDKVIIGMLFIGIIGLFFTRAINLLEKRIIVWNK